MRVWYDLRTIAPIKFNTMTKTLLAVALLTTICASTTVQATSPTALVYTNLTTFSANVNPGYRTETFDSLGTGALGYQINFTNQSFLFNAGTPLAPATGLYGVAGLGSDVWLSSNDPETIVFNFTSGNVTAVGGYFFNTDINGSLTNSTLTATINNGTTRTILNANTNSFLGFTSQTPITSLTLSGDNTTFLTANNLVVGVVPEPSTLALVAFSGMSVLWMYRRRQA